MSAATMPTNNRYDSAVELEGICREAATEEAAHDEAMRRRPNANPATVARQVAREWQRQADERRPTPTATAAAINKVLFKMPPIIDGHVQLLMDEATPDADFTEASLGEIFIRWHQFVMRRCRQNDRWLAWRGKQWEEDVGGDIVPDAMDHFCTIASNAALQLYEGKTGVSMQRKIGTAAFRRASLAIAKFKQEIQVNVNDLDSDDWALNTPSGILDLRTGETGPHDSAALCTKITNVAPISSEDFAVAFAASRFRRFLNEVFASLSEEEREELLDFLQMILGYAITGDTRLHVFLIFYGEGRNGKNTLIDLIAWVIGGYSRKTSSKVLMQRKHDAHPTEIADLRGVRLAVASEVSVSDYFDEALLKELSGDETLSARFMRQDFFTFKRSHSHVLLCNSKPRLRVTDAAIAARMKMIPFDRNFLAEGIQDESLPAVLREEGAIVLRWLIEGARKLHEAGLKLPRSRIVERQTQDYVNENDAVRLWVSERCSTDSGGTAIKTLTLYEDYRAWRLRRGEQAESIQRWKPALLRIPGIRGTTSQGRSKIVGIKLDPDRDDF